MTSSINKSSTYKFRTLRHRKLNRQYRRLVLCLLAIITLLLVLLLCSNKSTLQADDAIVKTYISKQIKPGDTLWDIADSNKLSYMDTAEYVTEIQKINNLKNSTLIAGEYIILPIYTSSASNV